MGIIQPFISWVHIISATLSMMYGFLILIKPKGTQKHKEYGKTYFYLMLINNLSALFIYNAFGKWFFPHTLAVITLFSLILAMVSIKWIKSKLGFILHIICFIISYYFLIGGAINEAFLHIPSLRVYINSPILGIIHMITMLFFIGLILYDVIKYKGFYNQKSIRH